MLHRNRAGIALVRPVECALCNLHDEWGVGKGKSFEVSSILKKMFVNTYEI